MKRSLLVGVLALVAAVPAASAGQTSPYAGQETRAIKSLSAQDLEDLRQGRGMGYAKAAELNGYPGPRHVLDMANALGLTRAQRTAAEQLFRTMRRDATALGAARIAAEADIEALFATGAADPGSVAEATARAAAIDGKLRAVHLGAHVALHPVLSDRQRRLYDRLRGYAGADMHPGHDPGRPGG